MTRERARAIPAEERRDAERPGRTGSQFMRSGDRATVGDLRCLECAGADSGGSDSRGRRRACSPTNTRTSAPPLLSPLVLQAFRGKSPNTLADVADDLRQAVGADRPGMGRGVLDGGWRRGAALSCRRARATSYFQLREQSDMLELVDPGAPARAQRARRQPHAERLADLHPRPGRDRRARSCRDAFWTCSRAANRPTFHNGSGRLELANAIASKSNPLTARVMVNRVWQHHFGDGFVSTPDDLGNQSAPPTHPELLDWLANRFMADNWSVKKLHKLILMSATWQQSSRNNPEFAEKDPFNHLLWRANVRRLEFEPLRDSILSIGGGLDLTVGGHPVDLSGRRAVPQGRGAAQRTRAESGVAAVDGRLADRCTASSIAAISPTC